MKEILANEESWGEGGGGEAAAFAPTWNIHPLSAILNRALWLEGMFIGGTCVEAG